MACRLPCMVLRCDSSLILLDLFVCTFMHASIHPSAYPVYILYVLTLSYALCPPSSSPHSVTHPTIQGVKFVHGKVDRIGSSSVRVRPALGANVSYAEREFGTKISYDYGVIASGSGYPAGIKAGSNPFSISLSHSLFFCHSLSYSPIYSLPPPFPPLLLPLPPSPCLDSHRCC